MIRFLKERGKYVRPKTFAKRSQTETLRWNVSILWNTLSIYHFGTVTPELKSHVDNISSVIISIYQHQVPSLEIWGATVGMKVFLNGYSPETLYMSLSLFMLIYIITRALPFSSVQEEPGPLQARTGVAGMQWLILDPSQTLSFVSVLLLYSLNLLNWNLLPLPIMGCWTKRLADQVMTFFVLCPDLMKYPSIVDYFHQERYCLTWVIHIQ